MLGVYVTPSAPTVRTPQYSPDTPSVAVVLWLVCVWSIRV